VAVALVFGSRLREAPARGLALRSTLKKRFAHAGVAKIETERAAEQAEDRHLHLSTGIIIGGRGRRSTS